MKKDTFKTIYAIPLLLALVLFAGVAEGIGSLTPSGSAGDDTQYSLNDIYQALSDYEGAVPASSTSPIYVPPNVSASFHTLSEIYGLLEAEEDDLVPEKIRDGITIFGITGTLEQQGPQAPDLDWITPNEQLCWDANQGGSCSIGFGFVDMFGNGSELLGAKEYCRYLNQAGAFTPSVTPIDIWRLPTLEEFNAFSDYTQYNPVANIAGLSLQSEYWTDTEQSSDAGRAWIWNSSYGYVQTFNKASQYFVACVK